MNAGERIEVTYRVAASQDRIGAVATAIAIEQSIECPLEAVDDRRVIDEVLGRVSSITAVGEGVHEVVVSLAVETLSGDVAQGMNMLFGNTSLHEHVQLVDVAFPPAVARDWPGPRFGLEGIRALTGVQGRALTCAALKPQGLPVDRLAELCRTFARAGVDVIKDDHGLADQAIAPFAARVQACQQAVDAVRRETGSRVQYVPNLVGSPRTLVAQARLAADEGCGMVMMAPGLVGLPVFAEMVSEHLRVPVLAHPSMGGAARIAPPLLFGTLYRLLGADAVIFVNHGGRFGYSRETSIAIADRARARWEGVPAALPVPAGGMTVERVPALLADYGADTMLLIGGSLLVAGDALLERTRRFVSMVQAGAPVQCVSNTD